MCVPRCGVVWCGYVPFCFESHNKLFLILNAVLSPKTPAPAPGEWKKYQPLQLIITDHAALAKKSCFDDGHGVLIGLG